MRIPYFDYAATAPVDPRIIPAMTSLLGPDGDFANPSSTLHAPGRTAAAHIEAARAQVAALLDADPREIVFTSGATEANNLAIKGLAERHPGGHIVTSAIEHDAVLAPCAQLEARGWQVTRVTPRPSGDVEPDAIADALRPDTFLVSLMHANNETGVINDIGTVGALCRARSIAFHVDAAQTAGALALNVRALPVDLVSLSAHKFCGPKGIGALYLRRRADLELEPQLHGGGQERGRRSGTLATHQIVGLGLACELVRREREADAARIAALRDRLWAGVSPLGGLHLNGAGAPRLPGHLNLSVDGVGGEVLLQALAADLAISGGSACHSVTLRPSHVLTAMGLPPALAQASLRFSLGRFTTADEIGTAIEAFTRTVTRLRGPGAER